MKTLFFVAMLALVGCTQNVGPDGLLARDSQPADAPDPGAIKACQELCGVSARLVERFPTYDAGTVADRLEACYEACEHPDGGVVIF